MSDQVVVGSSYLNEAANDLRMAKEKMVGLRDDMKQNLQTYTASWDGPAKTAYQGVLTEWDQSINDMETIIQSLSATVSTIGGNYTHTERSIEGQW